MSEGKRFVDKCLTTDVIHNPWPHQIFKDTLSTDAFIKLRDQCIEKCALNSKCKSFDYCYKDK